MNSILFFAFALAIAGAIIAYIGDRLGTYVGKKRISRFGLRPRHTATLYTTVSGGVISVLTLGFMVLFDHAFERALVEGPQLLFENSQYKKQIKAEIANAKMDQDRAQQALSQMQQAESRLLPVQQQLLSAQVTLRDSRRRLRQRQQQLGEAQQQIQGARLSLNTTHQNLSLARLDVQQAKRSLSTAEAKVTMAQQKVVQQQRRQQQLTTQNVHLAATNSLLQRQNSRLAAQGARLAVRAETSSRQPLIFRTDQEVGRLVVKTNQPVTVIENQLTSFLNALSQVAEQRGGRRGVNRRSVVITVPIMDGQDKPTGDYHPLNLLQEHAAINTLAQNIAGGSGSISSVVVVARAVYNTFIGEQTGVDLHPYDNLLIFPKDAVVATQTIDGAQSEPEIINALQDFLTRSVRPAVLLKGLIPQTDPQTGKPLVGAVDGATSLALAQQIERYGARTQVTAFAGEDTYSNGPLHLRLSVSPVVAPTPVSTITPSGRRS